MLALTRLGWSTLLFCVLVVAGQNASAQRSIRVDALDEFNAATGEFWPRSDRHTFFLDCVLAACDDRLFDYFGLSLNTSGSPFGDRADRFFLDNNRLANQFGETPGALKIYLFGVSQKIVPFYFASPADGSVTWNYVDWARGIIDAEAPFNESEAVKAIRFTWHGTLADNSEVDAQIVLLDRRKAGGAGDFDLELNYGRGSFGYPPGAMQGIHLNGFDRDVPLAEGTAIYNLSSRAGSPVPAPATVGLLSAGIALLGGMALRRRAPVTNGRADSKVGDANGSRFA